MMMMITESITAEIQTCIKACMECHKVCTETIAYCITQDSKSKNMHLISLIRDCSEMCTMCINMMMSGSEFVGRTCLLCAEICDRCRIACEKLSGDTKMMECAAVCRNCAGTCRGMQAVAV